MSEESVRRYADLQAANFVSPAQTQDRAAELLDQQQRLADLERAKASTERELLSLKSDLREIGVQTSRDHLGIQRSIAAVEQDLAENEARREVYVRAPQDGVVVGIAVAQGQSVNAGQTLASVLPAGSPLEVELYAPSRSAGFVRIGMPVSLRYQAYSFQKFGQHQGTVREISSVAMRPEDLSSNFPLAQPTGAVEAVYRIRVRLERQAVRAYGVDQPLRAGMTVDASIVLERRRLYEWILDPVYSIGGRV